MRSEAVPQHVPATLGEPSKTADAVHRIARLAEDQNGLVYQALKSCVEKLATVGIRCTLNLDPRCHQIDVVMSGGPVGVTLPVNGGGTKPVIEQGASLSYFQRPNGLVVVSRVAAYLDIDRAVSLETIKVIDPADIQSLNQFDFAEHVADFVEWAIQGSYRGATKEATERASGLK